MKLLEFFVFTSAIKIFAIDRRLTFEEAARFNTLICGIDGPMMGQWQLAPRRAAPWRQLTHGPRVVAIGAVTQNKIRRQLPRGYTLVAIGTAV